MPGDLRPSPPIDEQKERSNVSQPNAFAAAAAQMSNQAPPAQQYAADTSGNLTESFAGQSSQLFGGPVMPSSLMNKTHGLGTSRTGKIAEPPYDVQSRDFNSKLPKFWANTPVMGANGKMSKVTTNATDHVTGEKLRPVLDTVVVLETAYRFDAAECAAIGRDATLPDDGARAAYISGEDLKQLRAEIRRLGIRSEQDMVGLIFTMTRVGQKPNPGGNPSWINKIELSR